MVDSMVQILAVTMVVVKVALLVVMLVDMSAVSKVV